VEGVFERSKENALKLIDYKKTKDVSTKILITAVNIQTNQESIFAAREFWSEVAGVDSFFVKPFVTFAEGVDGLGVGGSADNVNRCTKPWTLLTVAWDGTVSPCCFDYDVKYPLGNVGRESLLDIWNGRAIISLRNEFDDCKIVNKLCKPCELGGGFDSVTAKSPKYYFRNYIRKVFDTAINKQASKQATVLLYGIGSITANLVADIIAEYADCVKIYGSDLSVKTDTVMIGGREISIVGMGDIEALSPEYIIILIRKKETGEEVHKQLSSLGLHNTAIYPCHDLNDKRWEI
jgi:radical SAM protein with 4Fe4S-binding SPASM domain